MIVIVGETASGKSALAIELATKYKGEIICADSRTVYHGMDIGTAKPTPEDQASIRHHVLDVVNPDESFNVSDFKALAEQAIADIEQRGKLPIMVGGTGLYIDAVLYDFQFLPPVDAAVRAHFSTMTVDELQTEILARGLPMPSNAQNPRHLQRTLETDGQKSTQQPLRPETLILGVTIPRDVLETRIIARIDAMMEQGLELETKTVSESYGWDGEAMKGVGYHEFKDYFEGHVNLAEVRQNIIQNTLKLAKKQRTWFKRNSVVQWLNDPREADDIVTTFLNKRQ